MPSVTGSDPNQDSFPVRYSRFVVRNRILMILLPLLLFFAGAAGVTKAGFNASYRVFFGKDNPQLQAFDKFQAVYTKDDNVSIVIHHPIKPVFSNEVLESVRDLTDQLWKTQYVTRVDSITNYQHTEVIEDDLIVDNLITELPLSEDSLKTKEKIALQEPLLSGMSISKDGRVTQINARVLFPPLDEDPNVAKEIYFAVHELVQEEQRKHPDIEYRISGIVAINTAFSMTPENEMKIMMPIMLGLIILFLVVLVRSIPGVIFPLLIVLLSIIFTVGLSGYLGILLTPVSATFPQILLAVAIAYSVHIVVSYSRLRRSGREREDAVRIAVEKNFSPIFLTAITTAIGFLSMTLNDVPPVQHLGIFVGIGVLFTFVISVTLLPALLAICPCRIKPYPYLSDPDRRHQPPKEWTERLGHLVVRHHRLFFYGLLAASVMTSLFIFRLELDNNPVNYFKHGTWYRDTAEFVDANLTGVSFTDFSFESGQPNGITDPAFLAKVKDFTEFLKTFPEVAHVNSIIPIMERLNRNMHGDDPAYYRLPESKELAAQYLLLYTLSLPFGLDLTNQINIDYSSTRVTATTHKISGNRHKEILREVDHWMAQNHPGLETSGTGPWVMFTFLSDRVIRGMLKSLVLALVLITAVCIVTFRSIRLGLLSMIPNGFPIVLTFGVWGMLGEHVDFAVAIVTSATLGIIVDDTIHLMIRYQRGKKQGLDPGSAFRFALEDVGHALLFTSIILIVGFGLFLLSGFRITSSMGAMISLSIGIALFYDFLFLPGALILLDRRTTPVKEALSK